MLNFVQEYISNTINATQQRKEGNEPDVGDGISCDLDLLGASMAQLLQCALKLLLNGRRFPPHR